MPDVLSTVSLFLCLSLYQMVPGGGGVSTMQRIPLPGAEMLEEEPLYVNAKQYHRILKRRQARAKLEAEGKIPKERRVRHLIQTCMSTMMFSSLLPSKCKGFKLLFLSSPATCLFCLSTISCWAHSVNHLVLSQNGGVNCQWGWQCNYSTLQAFI